MATFVVLAMALRTQPDALTLVLTNMKERPTYQDQDKLPVIIWMMAQVHSDKKINSDKTTERVQICVFLFTFLNF